MENTLYIFVILGFVSYWLIKIRGTIVGTSRINSIIGFFHTNIIEILLSAVGVVFLLIGGDSIPPDFGKIDTPLTAFIAGGSIPSMFMNFLHMIFKK
jgi:hypothetical protein